jgi:TRAP-type mannitol/chloroaromatic compound transport system permease large subunit
LASEAGRACDKGRVQGITAIIFVFLPILYAVIEGLKYALAWFGVLIAVDL